MLAFSVVVSPRKNLNKFKFHQQEYPELISFIAEFSFICSLSLTRVLVYGCTRGGHVFELEVVSRNTFRMRGIIPDPGTLIDSLSVLQVVKHLYSSESAFPYYRLLPPRREDELSGHTT